MSRKSLLVTKLTDWFTQVVQQSAVSLGLKSQGESQVSSEVNFVHLRYPTKEMHLDGSFTCGVSPCGGMTVAYKFLLDEHFNRNRIAVAFSKCDKRDHFNKRVGRIKAAGRLESEKFCRIVPAPEKYGDRQADQSFALMVVADMLDGAAVGDFLDMRTHSEIRKGPFPTNYEDDTVTSAAFNLSDDPDVGFSH